MKYCINLKSYLVSILICSKCNLFREWQSWFFSSQYAVFSVTWSFRNHSDMLIWCLGNILSYQCWHFFLYIFNISHNCWFVVFQRLQSTPTKLPSRSSTDMASSANQSQTVREPITKVCAYNMWMCFFLKLNSLTGKIAWNSSLLIWTLKMYSRYCMYD